jgi:L-ascorbate metabolism protein UlaG (beta-lactamase superfamily)
VPDIHYLGHACFRLRGRDGIIICDPYDRSVGLDMGRPTAHIVTVSQQHPAHNNVASVKPVRESVFVIDGPGEYEVRGVLVTGVRTRQNAEKDPDGQRGNNTVYVIHLDDVAFCHLGHLSQELTSAQLEEIGNVDVLFVPVGGGMALTPAEASSVISQIEPRLVIPMHYASEQLSFEYQLLPLEKFAHEVGLKEEPPEEKLTVTPASLPGEDAQARIVVMLPGSG